MAAERRYALTKIAPGDYMFPSNDGTILWRISRYTDGPSNGLEIPRDREFWGLWQWNERVRPGSYIDTSSWDRWDFCEGHLDNRRDVIDAAMRMEPLPDETPNLTARILDR